MKHAIHCGLLALLMAGCAQQADQTGSTEAAAESTTIAATPVKYAPGEELTLAVPEMHCQFGCYPAVKETLEGLNGVQTVELVPQEKEDELNDRRVIVTLDGELDSTTAINALAEAGFPDSTFEAKE